MMKEVNFGSVARFIDIEEMLAPDASYRERRTNKDVARSVEMLRRYFREYHSSASGGQSASLRAEDTFTRLESAGDAVDSFFDY